MASAKSLAQEATTWYLNHLDPCVPNEENVKTYLRGPVLALTLKVLYSPDSPSAGLEIESAFEEEKKTPGADVSEHSPWRKYLHRTKEADVSVWNEQDQEAYNSLGQRNKARMEAFLGSCALALPGMSASNKSKVTKKAPPRHEMSLSEALSGFHVSKKKTTRSVPSSPRLASIQASTALLRQISASSVSSATNTPLPQFRAPDLSTRLELYIRTLSRVRTLDRECVVAAEPARALRARANAVVRSFVATVGCVSSMGPSLTRLLQCVSKELLAEDILGEELCQVIRRLALEYEHQTSFASLAFLSSPEVSAETNLTPMIMSFLSYLQNNWKKLEAECQLEQMLSTVLDPTMRSMFKTIEFRSIGHLLEVCQGYRNELHSIELPPDMGGVSNEDVMALCSDVKAVKQAIRDLQREIVTVNGHVLPPVDSRKELVQLLSQTLNSRTLTASYGKKKARKSIEAAVRRSESCPPMVSTFKENADPKSDVSGDSDYLSSGNEGDSDSSSLSPDSPTSRGRRSRARGSFHLSTIDVLTRRLLIASSRTGKGGDAYFIVRDIFGGEDVEVVPSVALPTYGRLTRAGTIEILVRMASVTIKCHGSFDVYPKSLVGECEPLIQLHTTTTETIALQEVRATDSDDNSSTHSDHSEDGETKYVIRERKTDKTGWRTLTIQPALYEKVEVWNTPS